MVLVAAARGGGRPVVLNNIEITFLSHNCIFIWWPGQVPCTKDLIMYPQPVPRKRAHTKLPLQAPMAAQVPPLTQAAPLVLGQKPRQRRSRTLPWHRYLAAVRP